MVEALTHYRKVVTETANIAEQSVISAQRYGKEAAEVLMEISNTDV
jgi:hypothetical protein